MSGPFTPVENKAKVMLQVFIEENFIFAPKSIYMFKIYYIIIFSVLRTIYFSSSIFKVYLLVFRMQS
jgi:hypothetical protein